MLAIYSGNSFKRKCMFSPQEGSLCRELIKTLEDQAPVRAFIRGRATLWNVKYIVNQGWGSRKIFKPSDARKKMCTPQNQNPYCLWWDDRLGQVFYKLRKLLLHIQDELKNETTPMCSERLNKEEDYEGNNSSFNLVKRWSKNWFPTCTTYKNSGNKQFL